MLEMAVPFLRISAIGQVCLVAIISMGNIIRVQGRPNLGLAFMSGGTVLNALLAAWAIFGLHLGVVGAALATAIATGANLTAVVVFVQGRWSILHVRRANLRPDAALARSIVALGAPVLLMQVFGMLGFLAANRGALVLGGARGVAMVGALSTVNLLLIYPSVGVAQAMQPLVAYNRGAGHPDRVRALVARVLLATTAMGCLAAILVSLFPGPVASLFTRSDVELVDLVRRGLPWFMVSVAVFGVQGTTSHYFLAVQLPVPAGILLLGRQILVIPLFLILPRLMGFTGLYLATLLSDVPFAVVAAALLRSEWRKLRAPAAPDAEALPGAVLEA